MNLLYNIGIYLLTLFIKCGALFNKKLNKGVQGRKHTFRLLEQTISESDKTIWLHCASLGEYEQGLPVFSELRKQYKDHKIILSFFSPSGYEIRKNTPIADVVVYLPLDSQSNAKRFIDLLKPELSVFVKYDIWPNYLHALKVKNLKAILISAAFRKEQHYFKFYGAPFRNALFAFQHIFTQNEISKELLKSIGYTEATISGDTRFDRVSNQLKIDNTLEFINDFKNDTLCIVAGSTWPEDESLFIDFINNTSIKDIKFIVAPHNIKPIQIKSFQEKLNKASILFSEKEQQQLNDYSIFIVDTIGILTKIYNYADIAYVGGGMGNTGLHNALEAAVFGVPIIIGKNYKEFPEAQAMIDEGGMFSISSQKQFNQTLSTLINDDEKRELCGLRNKAYVEKNKGAVNLVLDYLKIK
ncbi:3-deoxy-D-manno-octulosonic acid transferase [Algibacter mikhailovii]|uniref:3-deoxy-D-manno-octulosonic acid transferase n=1 Tax=Algibacter mikhailovii TaxID=425498 RepID=A0A918QW79_9FLAO|nr:glycosyltransferase N-terminal domain-containing protein [Algibacter mikhailovii]GGZ73606.1 3-deoxy-D-manno-octulosonic acid transferase [Algibacter mikhailovii]